MMKTLKQTSAAVMLALAVLASGCAADEEMTTTTTTDGEDGELMTITVSAGSDADTRVAYDDSKVSATDNDALTWETDDKIAVVGWDDSYSYKGREDYILVAADAGKKTGSFTGKAIPGATKYDVVYLNTATQVSSSGGIGYSLNAQTQAGDGNTGHLKDNFYLRTTATTTLTDLSNVQLGMNDCAIMKFDLRNVPAEVGTLKKLTWTTEGASGLQSTELAFSQKEGEQVTFSSSKQKLTAYLVFDSNKMKVKPGGKFIVTLEGDKTYYAETTVANGKSYEEGKRYTATIDGTASTMKWNKAMVVSTTVSGGTNYYNGLKMQIGTWETNDSDKQVLLGEATIANGKAAIPMDLSKYIYKRIWVCIPKVVKFISKEFKMIDMAGNELTLPDKDGGSTLDIHSIAGGKQYVNDWIVALYMGVNQGGATGADAIPIYWATGNLIATKTNDANSGSTTAAFHIATAAETVTEASTTSTYITPTGIVDSSSDGYAACTLGTQWNKFGWGDATGLKTSTDANYASDITTAGASISGDANYDIARAKLGGSWRLPTSGIDNTNANNELAAFADDSFSGLAPDGMDWTESGYTGRTYTYTATDANGITNTLTFPAAGYRNRCEAAFIDTKGLYWNGTLYDSDNGSEFHFVQGEAKRGYSTRHLGLSVRPVTE